MPERVTVTEQESTNKSGQNSNSRLDRDRNLNHETLEGQGITGWQYAAINPFSASSTQILGLHRILGNRSVVQIIQAKLTVGQAGDQYEQEAENNQAPAISREAEKKNGWLSAQAIKKGPRRQFIASQGRNGQHQPLHTDLKFNNRPTQRDSDSYQELRFQNRPTQRDSNGYWSLPKLAEYNLETEKEGIWGQMGQKPTYYHSADQPNPYKLDIQGGKLGKGGEVLNTIGTLPAFIKDKSHRHMFTMSKVGEFYAAGVKEGFQKHGRVHHTTMTGGQEAAAAGELQINKGKLEAISDSSGHYRPGAAMTYQALHRLHSQGMDLSGTNVELAGKKKGQKTLSLSATEIMAYQKEMETALSEANKYRAMHPLDRGNQEKRETKVRNILNRPEKKIRRAHAIKGNMLQQLLQKTAGIRKELDKSGAGATLGQRDLTDFEYQEARAGYHQAKFSGRMTGAQSAAALQGLQASWLVQQSRQSASVKSNTAFQGDAVYETSESGEYLPEYIKEEDSSI